MNPGKTPEDRPVAHRDVPGEGRIVCENRVVANDAIMGHMHVGHDPVVVAYAGHTCILRGAGAEAAELADRITVADFKPGRLTGVFLVLRLGTDGAKLEDPVVATDPGMTFNDHMRTDGRTLGNFHVFANDRIRTNLHAFSKASAWMNDGSLMNHRLIGKWTISIVK